MFCFSYTKKRYSHQLIVRQSCYTMCVIFCRFFQVGSHFLSTMLSTRCTNYHLPLVQTLCQSSVQWYATLLFFIFSNTMHHVSVAYSYQMIGIPSNVANISNATWKLVEYSRCRFPVRAHANRTLQLLVNKFTTHCTRTFVSLSFILFASHMVERVMNAL